MKKYIYITIIVFLVSLFYFGFYHYTDNYEFGIRYNLFTGEIKPDPRTGHHLSYPWVLVTKIDTRPHRICIVSASKNINCRLVQFDPPKYMELIQKEGFHYYWWYNRFSFNYDQETYRGVDNLLLGHSYGNNRCSCVKVLQEIGDKNN